MPVRSRPCTISEAWLWVCVGDGARSGASWVIVTSALFPVVRDPVRRGPQAAGVGKRILPGGGRAACIRNIVMLLRISGNAHLADTVLDHRSALGAGRGRSAVT